jgi:uncharacterized protein YeaO (DUF488 family)
VIKTKSVHTPSAPDDGLRILATRFRGRGLPKSRYDVWMPNLGPSEQLLRALPKIGWREFARRYKTEMHEDARGLDTQNRVIKNHGQKFTLRLLATLATRGNVTVMCHCAEDQPHCHRHLLRKLIEHAGER